MTRAETQRVLAVLMRQGEWMLDDAAHSVGGGRLSQQRCHDTAVALEDLAAFLRECCAELPAENSTGLPEKDAADSRGVVAGNPLPRRVDLAPDAAGVGHHVDHEKPSTQTR